MTNPTPLLAWTVQGETTPPQGPQSTLLTSLMPLILIFAIFYFVMIRPEGKKRREREALLKTIKKGDKVMTTGGMYATVANVQEDIITLQAGDNVRMRFTRQAIQNLIQDDSEPESK